MGIPSLRCDTCSLTTTQTIQFSKNCTSAVRRHHKAPLTLESQHCDVKLLIYYYWRRSGNWAVQKHAQSQHLLIWTAPWSTISCNLPKDMASNAMPKQRVTITVIATIHNGSRLPSGTRVGWKSHSVLPVGSKSWYWESSYFHFVCSIFLLFF